MTQSSFDHLVEESLSPYLEFVKRHNIQTREEDALQDGMRVQMFYAFVTEAPYNQVKASSEREAVRRLAIALDLEGADDFNWA